MSASINLNEMTITFENYGLTVRIQDFTRIVNISSADNISIIKKKLEQLSQYTNTTLSAKNAYDRESIERFLLLLQIKYLTTDRKIITALRNYPHKKFKDVICFTYVYDVLSVANKAEISGSEIRNFINKEQYIVNAWTNLGAEDSNHKKNGLLHSLIKNEQKFLGGCFVCNGNRKWLWKATNQHLSASAEPSEKRQNNIDSSIINLEADADKDITELPLGLETESRQEKSLSSSIPPGNPAPEKVLLPTPQHVRDPAVVKWVRENANGKCESCNNPAPFISPDGSPYLEIHHVIWLRDGGADKVDNAIAICPNCHRELHYGTGRESLKERLYKKISRLRTYK